MTLGVQKAPWHQRSGGELGWAKAPLLPGFAGISGQNGVMLERPLPLPAVFDTVRRAVQNAR
jgi:hypothetical protein